MAEFSNMKPSPAELKYLIENWREPLVFRNLNNRWSTWDLDKWREQFNNRQLPFRKGSCLKPETESCHPQWERYTHIVHMSFDEFLNKSNTDPSHWYYFDYKRLPEWFPPTSEITNNISWKEFGLNSVSALESTIWIGSKGAHTPCHIDTYEYNLVMQIYGEKRWILIPPNAENMQPTRIPYEESSIYSKLNFFHPQLENFKNISGAREIVLKAGDILFVPQGWWHYVENLSFAISINAWIPTKSTHQMQLKEGIVQLIVSQFTKNVSDQIKKQILNPNNEDIAELPLSHLLKIISTKTEMLSLRMHSNKRFKFDDATQKIMTEENSYSFKESEILEKYSRFIAPIPVLSNEEFQALLMTKMDLDKPVVVDEDEEKNASNSRDKFVEFHALDKILNALCNPEVVDLIANKLLE